MFNLKLVESVRKKFKSTAHQYGTTMQSVLSAFVEAYITTPGKFKIKMEVKEMDKEVFLKNLNMSVKPVSNQILKMNNIEVRRVLDKNEIPTGEFHIKPLNGSSEEKIIEFINKSFTGAEFGLVDPSGELKLEYPIYLIVKDEMQKEAVLEFFEQINSKVA